MQEMAIGLLGFGTVGAGVVYGLQANSDLLAARLGVRPVLKWIADVDIETDRGVRVDPAILTTDAAQAIDDPEIGVIVELIGGTGVARDFVKQALSQGKPVVTANKALLAKHGQEIFELAAANKADIRFGASVGGAIPIIRVLREGLSANKVSAIEGIVNGTCNYILTRMGANGTPFDEALAAAQRAGFAEADPGLDIDGWDSAHKAVILASLACGGYVSLDDVHVEGIRAVSGTDMAVAAELGYKIKLLAVIRNGENGVAVRVHPSAVPVGSPLAGVDDVFNAVLVRTDLADETLCYGRGAGSVPTASTVLGDVCDVLRNLVCECPFRTPPVPLAGGTVRAVPIAEDVTPNLLWFALPTGQDAGATISGSLAESGVAVETTRSLALGDAQLTAVVTQPVGEDVTEAALADIASSGLDISNTGRIRVVV